ncbi:YcgL domain-containing protein [Aeromonas enteropelogenes]|uniref:YcgL domain-containing protein n=1 Tax=Aeromonas enteropelogenes TaxID=29489 RepID=UPI001CE23959|nr:YcgL domain-containing protein [Aeromonas enteropelogenes]MCZ0750368.1 YcgL domain-containing protein [Aeromonas enteropelogenes]UCA09979.1 YcgL domain-containing protein [Aeromonas enteropelogenes]
MLCAVYKSRKKAETYLFVERREDFSHVPEALMTTFGRPELVLMTKLDPAKPLGLANVSKVMAALTTQGFYLQVPPPPENLLEQHKAQLKKSG